MHSSARLTIAVLVIGAAALGVFFFSRKKEVSTAPERLTQTVPEAPRTLIRPPAAKPDQKPAENNVIHFTRAEGGESELGDRVTAAVERLVSRGNARTAVLNQAGGARWICILVAAAEPCYALDPGVSAADLLSLTKVEFKEAPHHVAQTLSRYVSVAKSTMNYSHEKGDLIFVFLCPPAQWDALNLTWPVAAKK